MLNGTPGDSQSFDALHELLEKQAYRLAFWRVSGEEINYRRFFDINDLVGLRMENPRVFAETHKLIRKFLAEDLIIGIASRSSRRTAESGRNISCGCRGCVPPVDVVGPEPVPPLGG